MNSTYFQGFALSAVAAVLGGTALAPLKFQRKWHFENTWLLYSMCAYVFAPSIVALVTVPHLSSVYAAAGFKVVALTALFGLGWGLAVILNGYAVTLIGLALTTGILMGSSIAFGSLIPILLVDPTRLLTHYGVWLFITNGGLLVGVLLCTVAGELRERRTQTKDAQSGKGTARTGILLCLLAGLLSTMQNVALTYGGVITRHAEHFGAAKFNATNAVWAIAITAGSVPSIVWCLVTLTRNRTWPVFRENAGGNSLRSLAMSITWIGGTVIYGAAAHTMGPLGPAIGWPIFMSVMIITAALWGWGTGEWHGAKGRPANFMIAGIVIQIIFMALLGHLQ